jgi:hypothetical protein
MQLDEATTNRLARELATLAPMDVVFRPLTVLHLVGLLQVALRHPSLGGPRQLVAQTFIAGAQAFFETCPTATAIIQRGNEDEDPYAESFRLD